MAPHERRKSCKIDYMVFCDPESQGKSFSLRGMGARPLRGWIHLNDPGEVPHGTWMKERVKPGRCAGAPRGFSPAEGTNGTPGIRRPSAMAYPTTGDSFAALKGCATGNKIICDVLRQAPWRLCDDGPEGLPGMRASGRTRSGRNGRAPLKMPFSDKLLGWSGAPVAAFSAPPNGGSVACGVHA